MLELDVGLINWNIIDLLFLQHHCIAYHDLCICKVLWSYQIIV